MLYLKKRRQVPEHLKILYGTLEKGFYTLPVMLCSLTAWLWLSQNSLTGEDLLLVVVVLVVMYLGFMCILLRMIDLYQDIKEASK